MAAALVVLGLAGAAVGAPAASASINCQWQPLSLQPGWHSEQSAWNSGDPAYCIDGGFVYLSGSLAQSGSSGDYFAGLPQEARPGSNLYLSVYTYGGTTGVVQIDTNGAMYAYGGKATQFTSLAGISFPMATLETGQKITPLQDGWQSADSQWDTGDPAYYLSNGVVHLSGSVYNPVNQDWYFWGSIPSAARPAYDQVTNDYTYGGAPGQLLLEKGNPDDSLGANQGNDLQYTSLAGITYPAAGAAETHLTPLNGWQAADSTILWNGPSYYLSNGVVYLDGGVLNTGSGVVAVLPPAARPTHTLYLTVSLGAQGTAVLQIDPDGSMYTYGGPPSAYDFTWPHYGDFTSFSGISYEVGE
jgi:hypothetical protein